MHYFVASSLEKAQRPLRKDWQLLWPGRTKCPHSTTCSNNTPLFTKLNCQMNLPVISWPLQFGQLKRVYQSSS